MKLCLYHLCKKTLNGQKRRFCSRSCNTKYNIATWRRNVKKKAVDYLGGSCIVCGYNKCYAALEFHHKDPTKKDFGIASSGNCRSWDMIKKELDKCDILCANCHRERHEEIRHLNLTPKD